ncbi:gliding motility-associated C-terminal domain-containing protein, partial [Crocinitomix catalasitica]|nr:gliding motility-associated C-terminal domain-containing protein [Crocinitomix catalasitica]
FTAGTGVLNTDGLAVGVYTFTYTVTGVAPCPNDVADFTVTVEQEAIAGPDNAATMCNSAGSTMDLNTLLSGAAAGTWVETSASGQFTPGTGIFDASGLAAATYTFTYAVTGIAPCVDDVADILVVVTNLLNAGGDNNTQICNTSGSTVDLNTLLSGADPGGTWAETTGSGAFDSSTGVLNTDALAAGTYTFTYDLLPTGSCPGDQSVFIVTVEQEVFAGADNTISICNLVGSTVDLNTLLSGADPGGVWVETSASGAFTPATGILNTDGLAAASYTFTYTVTAVLPCVDDVSNFTVNVEQEVNAGADNTVQACNYDGTTVDLNTLLFGADPGGVWAETTASGAFTSGTGVLNLTGLAGGIYNFTYTLTAIAPCLNDVANFTVTVDQVPTLTTITDEGICDNVNYTLPVFGVDVPSTFGWTNLSGTDIGFGTSGVGNIGSFTAVSGLTIDLTVTIEVTPTSSAGCVGDPLTFDVTIYPIPQITFIADRLIGCDPLTVNFDNLSIPSGVDCGWDFGDGSGIVDCGSVSHTYNYPGLYDVSLDIISANGCANSLTITDYINVVPAAVAAFSYSPDHITIDNTEIEFENLSVNADDYDWYFDDGTSSIQFSPTHVFPEIGDKSYLVRLIANNDANCPDTTSQLIKIEDVILFFVPNAFTPDGNQYNNTFTPVITAGVDIYDYHLTIFNRWGEILFESYNPAIGWDGTYAGQGLVQDGVYVWQIDFGETMSDKRHLHRGHVTILK